MQCPNRDCIGYFWSVGNGFCRHCDYELTPRDVEQIYAESALRNSVKLNCLIRAQEWAGMDGYQDPREP